jgi:multidrug efflux pump subunit AcrB
MIPIKRTSSGGQLLLRDVAKVKSETMPEEYDRINQMRMVSMTANIEGEDLGRVANHIDKALKDAGEVPRGLQVEVRGQVPPMMQMFKGLAVGLCLAVVVVFLMLTAYFQSIRLAIVAVATVPAVVAGVSLALYVTGTTLNIESFMGAIMAIGVAVANAILLVAFAERKRVEGAEAATASVDSARDRLRSIVMASCAMIAGMVPMALGLGQGGEQTAPLGRAVVGGLIAATGTTLFILPSIFAVVLGRKPATSASLHPNDRNSKHYDPLANEEHLLALTGDAHGGHGVSGEILPPH